MKKVKLRLTLEQKMNRLKEIEAAVADVGVDAACAKFGIARQYYYGLRSKLLPKHMKNGGGRKVMSQPKMVVETYSGKKIGRPKKAVFAPQAIQHEKVEKITVFMGNYDQVLRLCRELNQ